MKTERHTIDYYRGITSYYKSRKVNLFRHEHLQEHLKYDVASNKYIRYQRYLEAKMILDYLNKGIKSFVIKHKSNIIGPKVHSYEYDFRDYLENDYYMIKADLEQALHKYKSINTYCADFESINSSVY